MVQRIRNFLPLVLVIGALVLGFLAQKDLARHSHVDYFKPLSTYSNSLILYGGAIILFILATAFYEKVSRRIVPPEISPELSPREKVSISILLPLLPTIAGIRVQTFILYSLFKNQYSMLLVYLWLLSMVLFALAFYLLGHKKFRDQEQQGADYAPGEKFHFLEWLILAIIVIVTLALNIPNIGSIPEGIPGDEATIAVHARWLVDSKNPNLFIVGGWFHPNLAVFIRGLFLKVFGDNISSVRIASTFYGTLSLIALFFLARLMFARAVALLAVFLMAAGHYFTAYCHIGINNLEVTLLALLCFYFLFLGLRHKKPLFFYLSGLAAGLGFHFYQSSRILPVIIGLFILYKILSKPAFIKRFYLQIAILILGFFISFSVLIPHYLDRPELLLGRTNQVFLLTKDNLAPLYQQYHTNSVVKVVLIHCKWAFLAFNLYREKGSQYNVDYPLLDFFTSVLFLLGLALFAFKFRKEYYFFVLLWFSLVVFVGNALTIGPTPPFAPRLTIAMPTLFILAALTIMQFYKITVFAFGTKSKGSLIAVILGLLGLVGYSNYHIYYHKFLKDENVFFNYLHYSTMARYIQSLENKYKVYLLGGGYYFLYDTTILYLNPGLEGVNVEEPSKYIPLKQAVRKNVVYILMPSYKKELAQLKRHYPGGVLKEFRRKTGQLRFLAYEVSKQEINQVAARLRQVKSQPRHQ